VYRICQEYEDRIGANKKVRLKDGPPEYFQNQRILPCDIKANQESSSLGQLHPAHPAPGSPTMIRYPLCPISFVTKSIVISPIFFISVLSRLSIKAVIPLDSSFSNSSFGSSRANPSCGPLQAAPAKYIMRFLPVAWFDSSTFPNSSLALSDTTNIPFVTSFCVSSSSPMSSKSHQYETTMSFQGSEEPPPIIGQIGINSSDFSNETDLG